MNKIRVIGKKTLYNIDNNISASVWIREDVKKIKTEDCIELTSGIKIRLKEGARKCKIIKNALGYFFNAGNNVDTNISHVGLFTSGYGNGIGVSIMPINFEKCISLFSARKLITADWINSKDEYLAPDESNPKFKEFVNDSVVFSLFHIHSNQSSLRNVEYKNKEKNNE